MVNTFTTKDMLVRIMDKLDHMEEKVYQTHELATATNGKVKLHTKMIWGLAGAGLTVSMALIGWLVRLT